MTFISVAMGRAFKAIPETLMQSWPIGKYAAIALFLYFGIKTLRESITADDDSGEEFNDANEAVEKSQNESLWGKWAGPIATLFETFTLIFLAEWGDRSMISIISLSAATSVS